jgi:hypothetical protein
MFFRFHQYAAQPNLTSAGVVRTSRWATVRYVFLVAVQLAVVGLAIGGIFFLI